MKIYTRGGDSGETSFFGGDRVRKDHPRIEAYGTLDELNSWIGLVRASWPDSPLDDDFRHIQMDLFDVGAHLASPAGESRFGGVQPHRSSELEATIDTLEERLETLKNFILPGGSLPSANLHVVRTVCRRAERLVVALDDHSEEMANIVIFLNRLSDFLFVAARFANKVHEVEDVAWKR